jgi:hypothetical protein
MVRFLPAEMRLDDILSVRFIEQWLPCGIATQDDADD